MQPFEWSDSKPCQDKRDLLRYALHQSRPGLVCEFGVGDGTSLSVLAGAAPERRVVGFDSFLGLPEDWRPGYPAGHFARTELPDVPGAQLVVGMFADTLPGFLASTDEPIAFIHIDCDLYTSTATVLNLVMPRLVDTIIVFDEFHRYPGWERHEYRAWTEFVTAHHITFDYLAHVPGEGEQVAVQIEAR